MKKIVTQRQGYKVKELPTGRLAGKLPFFCPLDECRRITNTLDDKYMLEHGICGQCYVMYVEGRQKPLIDVEFYRKRMQEQGY